MRRSAPILFDFTKLTVVRGEKTVLRRFSVRVNAGEHVAILGPNGSGKSTLIKLMTGELYPLADVPGARFRLLGNLAEDLSRLLAPLL
jgi:iron complex transport system ATP-binding protein